MSANKKELPSTKIHLKEFKFEGINKGTIVPRHQLVNDPIPGDTLFETLRNSFTLYKDRKFLGIINESRTNVKYIKYQHIWNKTFYFFSGLLQLHEDPCSIAIYSKNSVEWVISDLACIFSGNTSVPISSTTTKKELIYILNLTECIFLICSTETFQIVKEIVNECKYLKYIIVTDSTKLSLDNSSIKVLSFKKIVSEGKNNIKDARIPSKDHIATIMFTSGSTGMPKGTVSTYDRWNKFIITLYGMSFPLVRLSFLPLSHSTERQLMFLTICFGGKAAIHSGDMSKIFEEHQLVNPTMVSAPPKLYDQIYKIYQSSIILMKENNPTMPMEEIEMHCKQYIKTILGNSIQILIIGGACSSKKVKEFIENTFELLLYDGYGSSEAGGIAVDGRILNSTLIKIKECPDLDLKSEPEKGIQRGELWVKTDVTINGYYKNEEATKEYFEDGWFNTGDIVEVTRNTFIRVIDRRKHFFKLSQGFYVSPTLIEYDLAESPLISHIFVYGDHTRDYLVSIIIPNQSALLKWAENHGYTQPIPELCLNKEVIDFYMKEIKSLGKTCGLQSFQIPQKIYLVDDEWTSENNLLTSTNKLIRRNIYEKYKDIIEELYNEDDSNDLENTIKSLLSGFNLEEGQDAGVDSLTTVQIWNTLNKHLNTHLSITSVIENLKNLNLKSMIGNISNDQIRKTIENDLNIKIRSDRSKNQFKDIKNVLLTGATGFLGSHILEYLFNNTDYNIYCIIRLNDEEDGKSKLINALAKYKINLIINHRIKIIKGDLSLEKLGIEDDVWKNLEKEIDCVIHSGALVKWIANYDEIRKPNVLGTVELINFCNKIKKKSLIFISSASTVDHNNQLHSIDSILNTRNHYAVSKWVSENIVRKALDNGTLGSIIRPGMITAHSITGASNPDDFVSRIFKGIIDIGYFFKGEGGLEMIPVDFVSKSIVDHVISKSFGKCYNIRNPKQISFTQLSKILKSLKYNLKNLEFENWKDKILQDEKNPIYPILPFLYNQEYSIISHDGDITYTFNDKELKRVIKNCVKFLMEQ